MNNWMDIIGVNSEIDVQEINAKTLQESYSYGYRRYVEMHTASLGFNGEFAKRTI